MLLYTELCFAFNHSFLVKNKKHIIWIFNGIICLLCFFV